MTPHQMLARAEAEDAERLNRISLDPPPRRPSRLGDGIGLVLLIAALAALALAFLDALNGGCASC